jgi:putative ABC transport system ATP-binding protein
LTYPGPPAVEALHPCDLSVNDGDYVAIVGPSGSGKSTFLNIIGLLDRPTEGTYFLDGHDTSTLSDKARTALRAHKIGFVFQSFHLLQHRTALENVMLAQLYRGASTKHRKEVAVEALTRVGMTQRLYAEPSTLSGGERQRVAIARALASTPSLLLCDEPTGNLDTSTSQGVLETVDELNRSGMTIMIITHDRDVASRAAKIVSIRDGRLTK